MGKIHETLRQPGDVGTPRQEAVPAADDAWRDEEEAEEEVPFIEVGPRRSFEASAAVLACMPAANRQAPVAPTPPAAPATPPATLPRPHNVLFRSLIPPSRFAPELVAFHAPNKPVSAHYGELLQAIQDAVAAKTAEGLSALLFTGVRPEIGATTVLLNIAIIAARQGVHVVVVDGNLRRPAVAERRGLEAAPGLTEVLSAECDLDQALRPTEQANLSVVTAGSPTPTLASVEALQIVLQELRGRFDLVLVDGPRWDGRPGVVGLSAACDVVFLVVPGSEADAPPASELVRTLPEQGVCLAGCILTSV